MTVQVFSTVEKRGHEQVTFFYYPQVGLKALVAIHNTANGPALGGCRMRLYTDESQALDDVLRLSEGMTYKSSVAGLDLGGGKACLIADPAMKEGRRELFLQFGKCLNDLNGRYITAEDMGTCVDDVMIMREVTKYAAGFDPKQGGGGDPSPWTAKGTFAAIKAACEKRYGSKDLKGKRLTVQGVGHVGMYLIEHLKNAGAQVTVCDTSEALIEKAKKNYGVEAVAVDRIYDVDCDIYVPCAIGQTVNPNTIKRLKCAIICGAANNQLLDTSLYSAIEERNILYVPDFVANAGGIICVASEYNPGGWKESWVSQKVENIYNTVHRVLDESEKRKKFTEIVAVEIAKERVSASEERRRAER